jgi:hypothetical protein
MVLASRVYDRMERMRSTGGAYAGQRAQKPRSKHRLIKDNLP